MQKFYQRRLSYSWTSTVHRLQFMVHDGDQNNSGGDVGQACVNIGPGTPENFVKLAK